MMAHGTPRMGGFSLIEALIALLLTSILAVVFMRMMGVSLLRTQESRTRAYAIHQMQSLAAAISANRAYWASGSATPVALRLPMATSASDCAAGECDPARLARFDMTRWGNDLSRRLSGVEGSASCEPVSGQTVCTITVSWRERGASAGTTSSQSMRFVP